MTDAEALNRKFAGRRILLDGEEIWVMSFIQEGTGLLLRCRDEQLQDREIAYTAEMAARVVRDADLLLADAERRRRVRGLPAVLWLLEEGARRRELTYAEINEVLPMEISHPDDLDEICILLLDRGIDPAGVDYRLPGHVREGRYPLRKPSAGEAEFSKQPRRDAARSAGS